MKILMTRFYTIVINTSIELEWDSLICGKEETMLEEPLVELETDRLDVSNEVKDDIQLIVKQKDILALQANNRARVVHSPLNYKILNGDK